MHRPTGLAATAGRAALALACSAAGAVVSACSVQDTPSAATPTATASTAAAPATPSESSASAAAASPRVTALSQPASIAVRPQPPDVTQDAASGFVPSKRTGSSSPVSAAVGLDYADPLAVAGAFVSRRLTYRYDDLSGYRAAVTARAFTTAAFAARSEPTEVALARVETAQESSAVRVGAVELAGEAPHTATTRYVSVVGLATTTFRGGGGTAPATWTLRLVQAPPGQWRVDGVLSAR